MSTPVEERDAPRYQEQPEDGNKGKSGNGVSDSDDGTYVHSGDGMGTHLRVDTSVEGPSRESIKSPSAVREERTRLEDDLALLHAERVVSQSTQHDQEGAERTSQSRTRSNQMVDDFDESTNPLHERAAAYNMMPRDPSTGFAKFIKRLHESSFIVRWFTYIVPLVLILLVPLLVGALAFPKANVGGVRLMWFAIWLEIVWLTLWAGRVCITCLVVVTRLTLCRLPQR